MMKPIDIVGSKASSASRPNIGHDRDGWVGHPSSSRRRASGLDDFHTLHQSLEQAASTQRTSLPDIHDARKYQATLTQLSRARVSSPLADVIDLADAYASARIRCDAISKCKFWPKAPQTAAAKREWLRQQKTELTSVWQVYEESYRLDRQLSAIDRIALCDTEHYLEYYDSLKPKALAEIDISRRKKRIFLAPQEIYLAIRQWFFRPGNSDPSVRDSKVSYFLDYLFNGHAGASFFAESKLFENLLVAMTDSRSRRGFQSALAHLKAYNTPLMHLWHDRSFSIETRSRFFLQDKAADSFSSSPCRVLAMGLTKNVESIDGVGHQKQQMYLFIGKIGFAIDDEKAQVRGFAFHSLPSQPELRPRQSLRSGESPHAIGYQSRNSAYENNRELRVARPSLIHINLQTRRVEEIDTDTKCESGKALATLFVTNEGYFMFADGLTFAAAGSGSFSNDMSWYKPENDIARPMERIDPSSWRSKLKDSGLIKDLFLRDL